jgi:hypothetical protein
MTGMESTEVKLSVIEMLTAMARAVDEADADAPEPSADLHTSISAVEPGSYDIAVRLPTGPLPAREVSRLVRETAQKAYDAAGQHWAQVVVYVATLFLNLAQEAPIAGSDFDLSYFLQWHALQLQRPEGGQGAAES